MVRKTDSRLEKRQPKRKISDSNRVGFLKTSKKYAKGREYNTLEGRIRIINRYLENGEIMISYQNIDKDTIVYAAELDVNTMLTRYAYEVAQKKPHDVVTVNEYKYTTEEIHSLRSESEALEEALKNAKDEIGRMSTELARQQELIEKQFDLISVLMGQQKRG